VDEIATGSTQIILSASLAMTKTVYNIVFRITYKMNTGRKHRKSNLANMCL